MYDILELNGKKVGELREIASKLEVKRVDKLKKQDLVYSILDEQALLNTSKKDNKKPYKKAGASKTKAKRPTEEESDADSKTPTKRVPRDSSEKRKPRESGNSKAAERRSGDSLRDRRSKRREDEDTNDSIKSSDVKQTEKSCECCCSCVWVFS